MYFILLLKCLCVRDTHYFINIVICVYTTIIHDIMTIFSIHCNFDYIIVYYKINDCNNAKSYRAESKHDCKVCYNILYKFSGNTIYTISIAKLRYYTNVY